MSPPIELININCPHPDCGLLVVIDPREINCAIFRHGVYKKTGRQMSPHAPKPYCDQVFAQGLIYGCGKPFKLLKLDGKIVAVVCDYI
jgi:hypothetical protein